MRFPTSLHPASAPQLAAAIALFAALPGPASGAIHTVGTGGTYSTIQAALDVAQANFESDEVRVRTGTYQETLEIFFIQAGDTIAISGGWDAAFAVRAEDPSLTVVDAAGAGRAIQVYADGSTVTVRGFTFTNGFDTLAAAGAQLVTNGTAVVRVEECRIVGNTVSGSDGIIGASGGGINASAGDDSRIVLRDIDLSDNVVGLTVGSGVARGGGAQLSGSEQGRLDVRRLRVVGNQTSGGALRAGAGLIVNLEGTANFFFSDSIVSGNFGAAASVSTGIDLRIVGSPTATLTRLQVSDNRLDASDSSPQVRVRHFGPGSSSTRFSDSWIVGGGNGVIAEADVGTIRLVNLTVAEHATNGVYASASPGATASTANSVFWDNDASDLTGGGGSTANLIGVDPLFADPGNGNYRLTAGSPARNTGSASPPGGLSLYDAAHAPRVAGPAPDRGAFEYGAIFGDGFESGDAGFWSE